MPTSADRVQLMVLMRGISERWRRRMGELLAEREVSLPMFFVLRSLDQPCAMRDIAERVGLDASTVTGIIDRLEAIGLVERKPSTSDRRVKEVFVTRAGRQLTTEVDRHLHSGPVFPELGDDDIAQLVRILSKVEL